MNRYRLNQILEILLFPVVDPSLAVKDPMLECFQCYFDFLEESCRPISEPLTRNKRNDDYQKNKGKLIDYLIRRNNGSVKSKDDIQMLCDLFYHTADMEQVMERMGASAKGRMWRRPDVETISVYYLQGMARIAASLITYRDGIAAIKQWVEEPWENSGSDIFGSATVFNKVEIWNLLNRMAVPDFFIAVAAVENNKGMSALYGQKSNISLADKLLLKSLKKGVAENHLHFKVGFSYDVVWLAYMDIRFIEKIDKKDWKKKDFARIEMALFRYGAARYLSNIETEGGTAGYVSGRKAACGFREWSENHLSLKILDILGALYSGIYEGDYPCRQLRELLFRLNRYGESGTDIFHYDYLMNEVYKNYVEFRTSSEFILLYQCYGYIKANRTDTFFARLFIQYLRLKNEFFSKSLQKHVMQGLKYFQDYYGFAKKVCSGAIPEEEIMTEIFRAQAQTANLKKLEIRIAPRLDSSVMDMSNYEYTRRRILRQLYGQIEQVLYAYKRYILESSMGVRAAAHFLKMEEKSLLQRELPEEILKKVRETDTRIPAIGIIFHFLKTETLEDRSGYCCWRTALNEEGIRTESRMRKRMHTVNVAMALEEMRESVTGMNEYIVGIDAASDENSMEPWMFAPAYKTIRSHEHTHPVAETGNGADRFERVQNIGFTYHVGEDFRHIVSGLRHVDEVLEEFGYKAGDRLGHALVLGTDVEQWMRDNEAVPLPKLEHLENLLWMWGTNTSKGLELPIKLEVLENKIMELALELYGNSELLNVRMLYRAYRKKFETNHEKIIKNVLMEEEKLQGGEYGKEQMEGCIPQGRARERNCYGTWTEEKLLLTHYCPVFEERYSKIELVSVSGDDAAVYKVLQNYLINKVEKKGIYIEENPTSNLTIGDFSYMHQHPIFKLNSKSGDGHNVFVTVNSDDPAVFNTNVENELAYIYYAADAQGRAKSEIIEWVDKIRQYGMDASFIQHEKSGERILAEIQRMLWEIRQTAMWGANRGNDILNTL